MNPTNEPVALTEGIRLVLAALLAVLTVFHVLSLSTDQVGALWGLYAAVSMLLSVIARLKSTPTAKVAMTTAEAAILNPPPAPPAPLSRDEIW